MALSPEKRYERAELATLCTMAINLHKLVCNANGKLRVPMTAQQLKWHATQEDAELEHALVRLQERGAEDAMLRKKKMEKMRTKKRKQCSMLDEQAADEEADDVHEADEDDEDGQESEHQEESDSADESDASMSSRNERKTAYKKATARFAAVLLDLQPSGAIPGKPASTVIDADRKVSLEVTRWRVFATRGRWNRQKQSFDKRGELSLRQLNVTRDGEINWTKPANVQWMQERGYLGAFPILDTIVVQTESMHLEHTREQLTTKSYDSWHRQLKVRICHNVSSVHGSTKV